MISCFPSASVGLATKLPAFGAENTVVSIIFVTFTTNFAHFSPISRTVRAEKQQCRLPKPSLSVPNDYLITLSIVRLRFRSSDRTSRSQILFIHCFRRFRRAEWSDMFRVLSHWSRSSRLRSVRREGTIVFVRSRNQCRSFDNRGVGCLKITILSI